jgi:hypothetical protein
MDVNTTSTTEANEAAMAITNNEAITASTDAAATTHDAPYELQVLALGLPRTGTLSMANALRRLGYKNVLHSLDNLEDEERTRAGGRAADATFSTLPTYTGEPFTRKDWDSLCGNCEAVTESAALFGPQLVEAYPDAKVVLVIRDFEPWF